ncbi:hypothetical protein [Octadecabacter ascidiaceicola]|uniref:Lipoprotein n=1 Tax=Octadecabacter ascidiaceicola TaxID=1655543 RepID=A0A238K3C9_9RHOB|nr:hypothetical protein [Octadecabacter ascidiaceicola]SMX37253.1 hypothetical protein OCA8868_01354 [Octadecabacter ascidiaceicola]
MKRLIVGFGLAMTLVACDEIALPGVTGVSSPAAAASSGGGGGFREYLVLGSTMSFEECRARGGIIIRDAGSPMIACDPRVRREPVPANEFDHPGSPVPQVAEVVEG